MTRLTRAAAGIAAPPVRIVHVGLGAFHRSHQAWFTARASAEWGIAAFTGRSPAAARPLQEQDGLYTLIERGADADTAEIVGSVARAHDGRDTAVLSETVAAPETALVTLTITEAGYAPEPAPFAADRQALSRSGRDGRTPETALGRLALALDARRRSEAGPLALVPCDNVPGNGRVLRRALLSLAAEAPDLAAYIESEVSMVSTSVDRITPAVTAADRVAAERLTGFEDAAPVAAEPFHDWTLAGAFPAGRPPWEVAGARVVDDITPYEQRKLWLLNGAHTILAAAGPLRRHSTVSEAMSDDAVRSLVEEFWDEAERHLPGELDVPAYRRALARRFLNPRIEHLLAQIARDSDIKLRARILPVLRRERADGREAAGCLAALAAWSDGIGGATEPLLAALADDIAPLTADVEARRARVRYA